MQGFIESGPYWEKPMRNLKGSFENLFLFLLKIINAETLIAFSHQMSMNRIRCFTEDDDDDANYIW